MSAAAFRGVFPYLVSPIHVSGEVDAPVLARLCDDLIQTGVHGLAPLPPQAPLSAEGVEDVRRALAAISALP